MLNTLLEIGNKLRNSEDGKIRYHRYFKPARQTSEKKKTKVSYWSVPVDENFEIKFADKKQIIDQAKIQNKLFYLTYKASENSPENKYVFGDIDYGTDKDGKEIGFYKLSKPHSKDKFWKQSSFGRGIEDAKVFAGTLIEKFRDSFQNQIGEIENFLKENGQNQFVHLHFDFVGKSWYEFEDELGMINDALLSYFVEKQNNSLILRNFIYKTLIARISNSPNFDYQSIFKTKSFKDSEEVLDLIYSLDYSRTALVSERDIKIVILPKGKDLEAKDIIDFFESNRSSRLIVNANQSTNLEKDDFTEDGDSLLSPVSDVPKTITQFDFIFSKRGDKKDEDLIEISGIQKHFLDYLNKKIRGIKYSTLLKERKQLYPTKDKQFWGYDIRRSFLNILGDLTSDKKKYQSHLFKVLPQIYSGNYFRDDVIMPAFIEKVEFNIRNSEDKIPNYNLLKYDYYFLVMLRNNGEKTMNEMDELEQMKNSVSYKAGLILGKMAQPLRKEINSFEKNYVGLLSRRIADKQGFIKMMNFVNEKLVIHDVAFRNLRESSVELADIINKINDKEYHKNYCAFGFFESYFKFNKSEKSPDGEENNSNEEGEN